MPAALASKRNASSKTATAALASSASGWGAGMARGSGRKLAPEISMTGAWACARTASRASASKRHRAVEVVGTLDGRQHRGVEEVIATGLGEAVPAELAARVDGELHLRHQVDALLVRDGFRDVIEASHLCAELRVVALPF